MYINLYIIYTYYTFSIIFSSTVEIFRRRHSGHVPYYSLPPRYYNNYSYFFLSIAHNYNTSIIIYNIQQYTHKQIDENKLYACVFTCVLYASIRV